MDAKNTSALVVVGIVAFIIGGVVGYGTKSTNPQTVNKAITSNKAVEDIKTAFNEKVKNGLIPLFSMPEGIEQRAIKTLNGKIIKKEADGVKVELPNIYRGGDFFEYLKEPNTYQIKVKIGSDTKIVIMERQMPSEEIMKDSKKMAEFKFFQEKQGAIDDLTEGTEIFVEAKTEFNLKQTKEIEAQKITLNK